MKTVPYVYLDLIITYLLFNIYLFISTFLISFFVVSPVSSNAKCPKTRLIKVFLAVVVVIY